MHRARIAGALAAALVVAGCANAERRPPTIQATSGQASVIFAADGTRITELRGEETREAIPLSRIPVVLQNAVVAIEDERFWQHNGVDLRGIARAASSNSEQGGVSQGGSTITQQYVKNVFLSPQRTIQRKIEEATLALQLEQTYSKKFILEQYLNTIFFGNRAYGVQTASKAYFGHPVDDGTLTVAEAALLAGLVQAPSAYDPYRNPDAALNRRNTVIGQLLKLGYITQLQHDEAIMTPLRLAARQADAAQERYPAPHFVEEVKRFIRTDPRFGRTAEERNDLLVGGGLTIYTTIDLSLQTKAEAAVNEIYPRQGTRDPDVGLVSIEPSTGYVRAMVGGYNYFDNDTDNHSYSQLNLAVGTGRQVGSTFKPIALVAALNAGISIKDVYPAPRSTVIRIAGYPPWSVSGEALGSASLFECTVHSANTCFGNLVADKNVQPIRVSEAASKMGIDISPPFKTVPSEVLGTNDNTVLEMTAAYDTFANRGVFVPPVMVTKVVRADGTVLFQHEHAQTKVLEPERSDDITRALEQVLIRGTAEGRGIDRPAAGKTGTTQDNTDAWFIGYTPDLVTGVWTGFVPRDGKRRTLPGVGAKMAAPVWQAFMKAALADLPPREFDTSTPDGPPRTTTTTVPKGSPQIFEPTASVELVGVPEMDGETYPEAAARARKAGLKVRRVDTSAPGRPPGEVITQTPIAGTRVPKGAEVVLEATPGNPPPTTPLPDILGQQVNVGVASLRNAGFSVSVVRSPAPPGFLLYGFYPSPGQIWSMVPYVGARSPDGKVTVTVQP